ncbi:MAG: glycosyltransferase involved in cell wall biosynthesis [Flavobacteriales bacterium]|jgi:glycosyltransferase involved in cell wall biosynthesis|tara:strand:- start:20406 stop:21554 length:1149 start_codon:yes stop_codon:yes gene_type:complete
MILSYFCTVKKKVIVSVINDLSSDQRVNRTCETLSELGFEVLLVGRELKTSLPLKSRNYQIHRMKIFFDKGAFFYAEYNIRLFLFLLFQRFQILHSNDLDTLLANYLVQKIKGGELVYDSHEYFTEVPELVGRKAQKAWLFIERLIFPKLKHIFTVNESISNIYNKLYNRDVKIMRNVPLSNKFESSASPKIKSDLGLPSDKKVLLLQGAGINVDRGAEEMVEAMQWIDAVFLIVGTGDVIESLKISVLELKLSEKVFFTGRVPFEELIGFTQLADVGVTLDKDTNLNYKYSLPNKLFDYFQADLPVIGSNLIEVRKIIDAYGVGIILSNNVPAEMAREINIFLENEVLFSQSVQNVAKAKLDLVWENEKGVLETCYQKFID